MGEVVKEVLPNGVTLLIKPTEGPGIVGFNLFIRGGITDEELPGVTNLTTYLLLKGSKNFSKEEISAAFEDFGGFISASTADEYGQIEFLTKAEGLKKGLAVLRDILLNPLFPQEDLEREKKNVLTAIRSKMENPFKFAYLELKKLTFEGTPYSRDPLGDEESVKRVTVEAVRERWKNLLKGQRFVVSLVGDVGDIRETLKLLKETFKDIPTGEFNYPLFERKIETSQLKEIKREGSQATILCAFNAPHCRSEYYPAGKLFNAVLGDGFTSLLFRELREKRGYAYATTSFYPTRVNMPRLFTYIGTAPQKAQRALEDMLKVTQEYPFGEKDVEIAKRKLIGDWLMDHQTRLRQSWYLGWFETIGLGFEMDFKFTDLIRGTSYREVLEVREKFVDSLHHCAVVKP